MGVEEVEDEELEEDTLELELELEEREEAGSVEEEEGECDSAELKDEVGSGLEAEGTELAPLPWGLLPSSFVPGSMTSARVSLAKTSGDRLRSILWASTWAFADAPSVKTRARAREQKSVRTSFLDLTLNILVKTGIFSRLEDYGGRWL